MPRSIDGQGRVSARVRRRTVDRVALLRPRSRRAMPGNGCVAEPGLVVVTPGSGVIMIAPVSVCHHVSTIGQRSPPMMLVVPDPRFRIDRLADRAEQAQATTGRACRGHSVPHLMNARIAVGAV